MSKISEVGYLFIHSGILEENQVKDILLDCIKLLQEKYKVGDSELEINVVKNKEGKKFGHTYAWVSNPKVFYALIGMGLDGKPLPCVQKPDPNWRPPEKSYDDAIAEVEGDWAMEEEIEELYKPGIISVPGEPLVTPSAVPYSQWQISQLDDENEDDEYGFIEIYDVKITKRAEKLNTIFSNNIPRWLDEKIMKKKLQKFERDGRQHSKKDGTKFTYPIVKIREKSGRRYCTVDFSILYPNTASFLINVIKRWKISVDDEDEMIFFSQSKRRDEY